MNPPNYILGNNEITKAIWLYINIARTKLYIEE